MALDFTFSLLDQAGGMKPKEPVTFREYLSSSDIPCVLHMFNDS
jgi:hypothetical protein